MQKKFSRKLLRRVSFTTNKLFQQATIQVLGLVNPSPEVLGSHMELLREAHMLESFTTGEISDDLAFLLKAKEGVDILYLKLMMELPTNTLEDIVFIHELGHIPRTNRTVEAITSELMRRSIFGDSQEN